MRADLKKVVVAATLKSKRSLTTSKLPKPDGRRALGLLTLLVLLFSVKLGRSLAGSARVGLVTRVAIILLFLVFNFLPIQVSVHTGGQLSVGFSYSQAQKVVDPRKQVTDPLVLTELARQGIDKDYVELVQDYAPTSLGEERSPYAKFYRDLKSDKRFVVISGLPQVTPTGEKIVCRWLGQDSVYVSGANLFSASVDGGEITATLETGSVTWNPQLFIDGIEVMPKAPILLAVDPANENYQDNVIEWDYGVCKRRVRIIEGLLSEKWVFDTDPRGDVRIQHNQSGTIELQFSGAIGSTPDPIETRITDDEEIVTAKAMSSASYPVRVGADLTVYSTSADGLVRIDSPGSTPYSAVHDASNGDTARANQNEEAVVNRYTSAKYDITRVYIYFDTSALGAGATISAATMSLRGTLAGQENNAGHPDICLTEGAQHAALEVADYGAQLSKTTQGTDSIWTYPINTGAYTTISLNAAGRGWINKTGTTKFCLRAYGDLTDSTPTGNNFMYVAMNEKGAGYLPKLVVTYTVASGPTMYTGASSNVGNTTATVTGNVTASANNITDRGFVWDTSSHGDPGNVAIDATNYTNNWSESGNWAAPFEFSFNITGLAPATTYFWRVGANDTANAWAYGNEATFTTIPDPPTNVAASDGTYTTQVEVTWTASSGNNITGYDVHRDGVYVATVSHPNVGYNDTAAAAPTITPGAASAGDGGSTAHITASLGGESASNGASGTYNVTAYNSAGNSTTGSNTDTGYKGTTTLTYQWYYSADDITYNSLGGATTDPHDDTTAPAGNITAGAGGATDGSSTTETTLTIAGEGTNNGVARYYLCEVSMSGATSQNSTSDDGYRGVGAISYLWYRSAADADNTYSSIGGATDPYSDTTAPAPTVNANNATACDGCSGSHVTLSSNETASDGAGRWFLCELSAAGAASQNTTHDRGYRGTTTFTYQWWRSSDDTATNYTQIGGGTTDPYDDVAGVVTPDGRYYLSTISMTGAASANTTADRGYKAAANVSVLTTLAATNLDCTTATLSANITSIGGSNVTTRGFDYGTTPGSYSWGVNETGNWDTPSTYSLNISSLSANTTYYYRGFAINGDGTGYGGELAFNTTGFSNPTVTNSAATGVGQTGATLHGDITDIGCCNVTTRGFEWGTSTGNYTVGWNGTGSWGTGAYQHTTATLTCNTTYFWRAVAVNCYNTTYSAELTFNTTACSATLPMPPTNLVVTRVGTDSVNITWTAGVNSTTTVIVISSDGCPDDPGDDYLVYNSTGATIVVDGLDLDNTEYCISAWGWNTNGYSTDHATARTGGERMIYLFLSIIPLGLLAVMFAKREVMLGFPSGIFWAILGAYAYTRSTGDWSDWNYVFFFACMMMAVFSFIAMYALRKRDLAGPDADEGGYIDEGEPRRPRTPQVVEVPRRRGSWGDIDELGMYELKDDGYISPQTERLHERLNAKAETRRERAKSRREAAGFGL